MNVPEEYVPTEAELPSDHWSKSPEWLKYKADQAAIQASPAYQADVQKLKGFMQVGTITPLHKKMNTHDLQMEACKVEWVDPNAVEETPTEGLIEMPKQADAAVTEVFAGFTETQLEDIAKTILARISKVTDDAQAG